MEMGVARRGARKRDRAEREARLSAALASTIIRRNPSVERPRLPRTESRPTIFETATIVQLLAANYQLGPSCDCSGSHMAARG